MSSIDLAPAEYRPAPPDKHDYPIGLLGCGGIARHAHLPAYRQFGYRVVAACDLVEESVHAVQRDYGVDFVTTRVDEFLARGRMQIIDLAVHANQRLALIERICADKPAGLLGILSQKPLAMSVADAERMVELCEQAGILFMVNQQARWAPPHRAMKLLAERGAVGHVYAVTHFHRQWQDAEGSWFTQLEHANIVDHGIHYLDLIRYFAEADPLRVKTAVTMVPGQHAVTPMIHTTLLEFAPERMITGVSHFNNIVQTPRMHGYDWYLDGTEGSIHGSYGEVSLSTRADPLTRRVFTIQGSWFPEAFGGSMGELMLSLTEGREPLTSGRRNLVSVRMVAAAVQSGATGEAVAV